MRDTQFDATKATKEELAQFLVDFGKKYSLGYVINQRRNQLNSYFDVDEVESLMYMAATKVTNRITGSLAQKKINEIKSQDVVTIEDAKMVEKLQKTPSIDLYKDVDDFSIEKNVVGLFVKTFNREVNSFVEKNLRTFKRGYDSYTTSLASFEVDYYAESSSRVEMSMVLQCKNEEQKTVRSEADELCDRLIEGISEVAPSQKVEKYQNFFGDVFSGNCSVQEALKVHKIGRNGQGKLYEAMAEVIERLGLDADDMQTIEQCLAA